MMDEQNVAAFDLLTILRRQNAFCIRDLPPAQDAIVTTSTIVLCVGDPDKPSFATIASWATGRGDKSKICTPIGGCFQI